MNTRCLMQLLICLFLVILLTQDTDGWRRRRRRRRSCSPTNCQVSSWSAWSSCTTTCGTGTQTRRRSVISGPSCGGSCNYQLTETRNCRGASPRNCQVSSWSSWNACSATCGTGTQTRTRAVTSNAICGGSCTHHLTDRRSCSGGSPRDCQLSAWAAWSACSASCGTGHQTRTRTITSAASCGGSCNRQFTETRNCSGGSPRNCQVSSWSTWSTCSKSCGTGTKTRTRNITSGVICGGSCNHHLRERRICRGRCHCPLYLYGDRCQYRYRCGNGYFCRKPRPQCFNFGQCFLRYRFTSNVAWCPHTHFARLCYCRNGCGPSTLYRGRKCICHCGGSAAGAICCAHRRDFV